MKAFASLLMAALFVFSGCAGRSDRGPANRASSRYSNRMHDRFYEAWVPPASISGARGKIKVPADITIDAKGRVRSFQIAKSSGYPALDESVRAVGRKVTKVARPPATPSGSEFHLRVFFELDVKR